MNHLTIDLSNYVELASMILFGIGLTLLLVDKNLIKKNIAFAMKDSALYLFLAAKGYIFGRKAPIAEEGIIAAEDYINPIPAGLVLTGIVVSVACSAVFNEKVVQSDGVLIVLHVSLVPLRVQWVQDESQTTESCKLCQHLAVVLALQGTLNRANVVAQSL
jgi:multicomponent Na+:H+ antiporter subunit C